MSFAPFASEEINEFEVDTEFADVSLIRERSTLSFGKREDSTCDTETASSSGGAQVPKLLLSHLRSEKPILSVREMCETSSGQIWPTSMKLQPSERHQPPVWVGQRMAGRKVTRRKESANFLFV